MGAATRIPRRAGHHLDSLPKTYEDSFMIIFLAGVPARVQDCPNAIRCYEHVLFSMAVNLKKDMKWMFKRKKKELKNARKS
jgi:hypothetical protein